MEKSSDDSEERIFRFTDFAGLVDVIQKKALTFVTRDLLEDPYEGFIFRALGTSGGRERILDILREYNPQSADGWLVILQAIDRCWYLQSWTRCAESDALWRIYSRDNRAIRIEASLGDVVKLPTVKAYDVEYKDIMSLRKEIESIVTPDKIHLESARVLLCKRSSFSHEHEVRLISLELSNMETAPGLTDAQLHLWTTGLQKLHQEGKLTEDQIKTGLEAARKKEQTRTKEISFAHLENFLRSVMVHPLAPQWFCETVETYCRISGVPFAGKSALYTFGV